MTSQPDWLSAEELLREFYDAFGFERAPRRFTPNDMFDSIKGGALPQRTSRAMGKKLASMTSAQRTKNWERELVGALPTLREVVADVRTLGASLRPPNPLPNPASLERYRRDWATIVAEWNAAITANGWNDLAPLCDACGIPVFVREHESTVCCDDCQVVRKDRRAQKKRREKSAAATKVRRQNATRKIVKSQKKAFDG